MADPTAPPSPETWRRRCTMCGGYLGADRPLSSDRCSCCGGDEPYNPRHDKHLDERVLAILIDAVHGGGFVDVARLLATDDRDAVREAIDRLRAAGWCVVGRCGHHGGYALR